jgi:hypothetical protein
MPAEILFARSRPKDLQPKNSLGAKWLRLLEQVDLASIVAGWRTAVKMHLGGGTGFTTVHPFFVRKLVERVKAAGAREVFVTDVASAVRTAAERGYCPETLGCPILAGSGPDDRNFRRRPLEPHFLSLKEIQVHGEIADSGALLDLSHVKGHGDCGFGGAAKNLAMGCVTQTTRRALHALEGGLVWEKTSCSHCGACVENCPNGAASFDEKKEFKVFYHHCKFCQHCVLICPTKSLRMEGGRYRDFQQGLAFSADKVLEHLPPKNVYYFNLLLNITIYCDCWGMSSPALVPDVGILAGGDLAAVEQAGLDLIRAEDLIPGVLPDGMELGPQGHLFERIHRKDPFVIVEALAKLGRGQRQYALKEVD